MNRPHPRIAVTGVGVVSGWGWGRDEFWRGVLSGETAIRPFSRFQHDEYATHLAGEVPPLHGGRPSDGAGRGLVSIADRFALTAAHEALGQAGLGPDLSSANAGVFFGSSTGGMFEGEAYYAELRGASSRRLEMRRLSSQQPSGPAEAVARSFEVTGPVWTDSSACASTTLSIGAGLEALRASTVDVAVTGGADSLCRTTFGGFNALRAVDSRPCRPFREDRAGMSLGEGGAVLVLERLDAALARGIEPLAEVIGAGSSADAIHMTAPDPTGASPARAVRRALEDAGITPDDVDLINAHATGTQLNDQAEFLALEAVFGKRLRDIPILATKASVGHLLGTAGAIEAAATVLCLKHGCVHATVGDGPLDPRTPVNLPTTGSRELYDPIVALSLNLAFGGCNGTLVFTKWRNR